MLVAAFALGAVTTGGGVQIGFATLFCLSLLVAWALWPLRELTRR